ncbi:hypothetical protein AB6A40_002683 [Gnathostoma spinigerum]|uniref:Uncharacterized protein n=1 Tax=Gnathostoma spinigerum TaxID=75299 RepID=A0ABD6E7A2_9BILA
MMHLLDTVLLIFLSVSRRHHSEAVNPDAIPIQVDAPISQTERRISPTGGVAVAAHGAPIGCTENDFRCNDGKCIRLEWKCDGSGDCTDGEDEKDCQNIVGETLLHDVHKTV